MLPIAELLQRRIMSSRFKATGTSQLPVQAPLVSVLMLAYNHEKFIRQAVESAMMQETDFPFELVVGEDCSTDGTRSILLELKNKYRDRIRLLLHEHNIGPHRNTEQALGACRGKYIATLEGDDYWISGTKLQEQVDIMEQYPNYAICCHAAEVVYEGGRKEGQPLRLPIKNPPAVTCFNDLLRRGNYLCAPTVMFRSESVGILPEWHRDSYTGDWTLWLLAARQGSIRYLDKSMAVSRRHGGGRWSTADKITELKHKSEAARVFLCNLELTRRQRFFLKRLKARVDWRIAALLMGEDDCEQARKRLRSLLQARPWSILHPDVLFLLISSVMGKRIGSSMRRAATAVNDRLGRFRIKCKRTET